MRTQTTTELAALASRGYASGMRVQIANQFGALYDFTSHQSAGGRNFVRSVRVEHNVDQDFATATIALHRQLDRFNLSIYHSSSAPNVFGTALGQNRLVVISAYIAPLGATPTWIEIFRGRTGPVIESVDTIEVRCFDLGHELADAGRFLEKERQYGSTGGVAVQTVIQDLITHAHGQPFVVGGTYVARQRVTPPTPNGYWYRADGAGVAGANPVWPAFVGGTVVSGAVTFRNMGTVPQLWVPTSPVWTIAPAYNQKREPCWSAIRTLVNQFGWDLRFAWDPGTSTWRLKLSEPPRTKTTPDFTMSPDVHILDIPTWQTGIEDVRTVVEGVYSDPADLDEAGVPKRKTIQRRASTSEIDSLGWRWMMVAEGATSQINTQAEMERMLDALLADMKAPLATQEVVLPLFPHVELGDLYAFSPNDALYTATQTLAVVGFVHEMGESGAPTTRLTCRGKPTGGFDRWRSIASEVAAIQPAPFLGPDAPTGVAVVPVVGGLAVTWSLNSTGKPAYEYEVHVSKTALFTATALTLACVVQGDRAELGDLDYGATHYMKVIARDDKGNRSSPSTEVSGTPGYLTAAGIQPYLNTGSLLPNGDFESLDDLGFPELWSTVGYVKGTDVFISSSSMSGANALVITEDNAVGTKYVKSPLFIVRPNEKYAISIYAKRNVLGGFLQVDVEAYDGNAAPIGNILGYAKASAVAGTYEKHTIVFNPGTSTRYVGIEISSDDDNDLFVDSVFAERVEIPQEESRFVGGGLVPFQNGWVNVGGTRQVCGFWKDSMGVVHMEGWIKNGTMAATAITLPAGYRPDKDLIFSVYSWNGGAQVLAHLIITPAGLVIPQAGSNVEFVIEGVTFRAKQ